MFAVSKIFWGMSKHMFGRPKNFMAVQNLLGRPKMFLDMTIAPTLAGTAIGGAPIGGTGMGGA